MNRFVLDNSVAMRWILDSPSESDMAYAETVLNGFRTHKAFAPTLLSLEMANVLAGAERRALISEQKLKTFLGFVETLTIHFDPHTHLEALHGTLDLARRYKLSSYDAAYLELALRENIPLATLDADLRKALKKAGGQLFGT